MKEAVFKFFTSVLVVLIFWGMLHAMRLLSDFNDYNYIKYLANKNAGLASDGPEIPAVSAKAPAEVMRTEPAPITAEDLYCIYLDGIRFDFPITLAMLQENFDLKSDYIRYNEERSEYLGQKILLKNGIGTYRIGYSADSKDSSAEECIVEYIRAYDHNEKYFPQLVIAGFDVFDTSEEEYLRLTDNDKYGYLLRTAVAYPGEKYGYVEFDLIRNKEIHYYKNENAFSHKSPEVKNPYLIKKELRLPEDYDPDIIPDSKEKTRKFIYECFDEAYVKNTVDNFYLTAYEFLAWQEAEYYEIESLRSIMDDDRNETGYLYIEARCHIKGYEDPVYTEMVLKAGEPLGNGLIIRIDL